jgi:hypothetical protein
LSATHTKEAAFDEESSRRPKYGVEESTMPMSSKAKCPCGSGRRYRSCCEKIVADRYYPDFLNGREDAPVQGFVVENFVISPYAIFRTVGTARQHNDFERFQADLHISSQGRWSIAQVAAMSTDDIIGQLRRYSVAYNEEVFCGASRRHQSAWYLSREWWSDSLACRGRELDFLGLAACDLWKRLIDRPSMEQLDDWMQEGYDQCLRGAKEASCETWWRLWKVLHPRFTISMTTFDETHSVFCGSQRLCAWVSYFERTLRELPDIAWTNVGIQFCRQVLGQFTAERETVPGIAEGLAVFQGRVGAHGEALATLEALVKRHPEYVWGYLSLCNLLERRFQDRSGARHWLEMGLQKVSDDNSARDALSDRLSHLKDETETVTAVR